MHHLAILKKGKLLKKIISGEKTIESRWYKHRKTPYKNIKKGDIVYLKESGEPVTAKAKVKKALFFDALNEDKIRAIIKEYGTKICVDYSWINMLKGKNFCTLIFLDNVNKVKPFKINKKGYGLMAAWISVDDIKKITSLF